MTETRRLPPPRSVQGIRRPPKCLAQLQSCYVFSGGAKQLIAIERIEELARALGTNAVDSNDAPLRSCVTFASKELELGGLAAD